MKNRNHLNFNQKAPDLPVSDVTGKQIMLSSLWSKKPLLLAFTRHFGCTQCKEMLSELVTGKEKIEASGLGIAVVMQGTPEASAKFGADFAPGLQVFADPERKVYKAYKLEQGDVFQTFLNWKVWKAIRQARKKGYFVERPPVGQDSMQMAGIFVISKAGLIELPYYYDNIADHPTLELLLEGVLDTQWDASFDGPIGPGVKKGTNKSGRGK